MKTCDGTSDNPRIVLGKGYCPQCCRPVRYKRVEGINMVTRHYEDGSLVNTGPREGFHRYEGVAVAG
jgi:hypothetical protein